MKGGSRNRSTPQSASGSPGYSCPASKQHHDQLRHSGTAVLSRDGNWRIALEGALEASGSGHADLAFLFVSSRFQEFLPDIAKAAWEEADASLMIGCTSPGIIANGDEETDRPAIALLRLSLPGATLRPVRFTRGLVSDLLGDPSLFHERTGIDPVTHGWVVFSDPLQTDAVDIVTLLNAATPGVPVTGGLASPGPKQHRTWVFLNGEVYANGAVGIAVGGAYEILPVLAHGCEPIGESWTITDVRNHLITGISNRPAIQVLAETLDPFSTTEIDRIIPNLSVGLAANEYQERYDRGDYLVRTITGIDASDGGIAIAARPRMGQTLQFHVRDSLTAHLDLIGDLARTDIALAGRTPAGGILLTCKGRESGMFGESGHDAQTVARHFPDIPFAGIVAAGEIGQVGDRSYLHGFAASAGLFVPVLTDETSQ